MASLLYRYGDKDQIRRIKRTDRVWIDYTAPSVPLEGIEINVRISQHGVSGNTGGVAINRVDFGIYEIDRGIPGTTIRTHYWALPTTDQNVYRLKVSLTDKVFVPGKKYIIQFTNWGATEAEIYYTAKTDFQRDETKVIFPGTSWMTTVEAEFYVQLDLDWKPPGLITPTRRWDGNEWVETRIQRFSTLDWEQITQFEITH